ncbi:hypothetical protein PanWU01x14_051770 [Parasponia andersonii]|uniref:Uncharacterized protein n=1 Tax=Parasponia andersonii TaxID=3476 RepID=A0A2P5DM38_PARAD|nr:hypothetical protein PanWU01x14_051770 [Parasponia andersonii]
MKQKSRVGVHKALCHMRFADTDCGSASFIYCQVVGGSYTPKPTHERTCTDLKVDGNGHTYDKNARMQRIFRALWPECVTEMPPPQQKKESISS